MEKAVDPGGSLEEQSNVCDISSKEAINVFFFKYCNYSIPSQLVFCPVHHDFILYALSFFFPKGVFETSEALSFEIICMFSH